MFSVSDGILKLLKLYFVLVGIKGAMEQRSSRRNSAGSLSVTRSANNVMLTKANFPLRAGIFLRSLTLSIT